MGKPLNGTQALAFVREHGIVLASAKGPAARLIEAILGEPIVGNWWSHPKSSFIYNVLVEVSESDEVVVCRLIDGKLTLVHRRLWPALVRAAARLDPTRLAKVEEEHTPSGKHVHHETPFPNWVPADVKNEAAMLNEAEAMAELREAGIAAEVNRQKGMGKGKGKDKDKHPTRGLVASLGRKRKG